ncbi:hypothetical protein [Halomonas sp. RT37]|uniref:Uncharacterized protein n=1 Tax=Halomonas sp. RT37 TaxID=2950872 RepID=A0AAU7KCM8_9GAMM
MQTKGSAEDFLSFMRATGVYGSARKDNTRQFQSVDYHGLRRHPINPRAKIRSNVPKDSQKMATHDRHIDERLALIEQGLERRMADLQRFQERAEDRFERATERHDAELALQRQKTDESYRSLFNLVDGSRKHASNMAAVTIFGTIGGVLAALALVTTLGAGWISDQGTYAKSYGENQVEMQQAADERAEFRETMKSIQATQQAILDRLPESPPAEQQAPST